MEINKFLVIVGLFWILIGTVFNWGVLFGYGGALLILGLYNYTR